MNKFQVGDIVKCIDGGSIVGLIAEIIKCDGRRGYEVKVLTTSGLPLGRAWNIGDIFGAMDYEMELLELAETKNKIEPDLTRFLEMS